MRLLAITLICSVSVTAGATGFTDVDPPPATGKAEVHLDGAFRVRGVLLDNLDLDRGLTPAGLPIFPVPAGDPNGQVLTGGDARLRTDLTVTGPGAGFAVKVRADLLDNTALGGTPDGMPAGSTTQRPGLSLGLKRAYGEAYTPFGVVSAGRMGNQWGLGMLANGGDCADCDRGDAVDRLAFVTPLAGHLFALAYDFSATGPMVQRSNGGPDLAIAPSTDVRSVTFAFLRWRSPRAIDRRRNADVWTLDYGAYGSWRWQANDVPSSWLPVASPTPFSDAQVVSRDATAFAVDGWMRLIHPLFRVELEVAGLFARIGQTSLLPGVLLRGTATSRQFGGALESEFGRPDARLRGGFDAGFASGDPAPGFGAFPTASGPSPKAGELDGAQVSYPRDLQADNFRFSSDYRVDRILFREIIGTITDAVYLRPHMRFDAGRLGPGTLTVSLAAIASFAMEPTSTPGGTRPLGLEFDPTILWTHTDGFSAALEHALLLPFSGFDNPAEHKTAHPAQLLRLRLAWVF
jgi:uncharacterized protein (TIGR04551 family)